MTTGFLPHPSRYVPFKFRPQLSLPRHVTSLPASVGASGWVWALLSSGPEALKGKGGGEREGGGKKEVPLNMAARRAGGGNGNATGSSA